MKKSTFSESRILAVLKEGEAGVPVARILRKHGISQATYYNWKAKYGGASPAELKRLKELEAENAKLKRMYADLALRTARSRKFLIESFDVVSQARGSPDDGGGAGPVSRACLFKRPAVAGDVLPAGRCIRSRRRRSVMSLTTGVERFICDTAELTPRKTGFV